MTAALRQLPLLLFSLFTSVSAFADAPAFSDSSQRLMAVQLNDGLIISESMPVYPVGQKWYLPLGEFAQGAGLAIEVSAGVGNAAGFIIDEKQRFNLKIRDCKVEHDGIEESYECTEAIAYEDDIYVSADLLKRIMPVGIEVNTFRSQITVNPFVKFPIQQRRERQLRTGSVQRSGGYEAKYPRVDSFAEIVDGVLIDQQLAFSLEQSDAQSSRNLRHDSIVSGELFGMEATAFVSGNTERLFDRERYSLAKRNAQGGLLGPLNAKNVQILDVDFPTLPLIGGAGSARGLLVSSYPLQNPTNFGTRDFQGDLASGWEVELFQNESLIGRATSINGRYEFKNVLLQYGTNRFRLSFYGPQGQRRESFETYSIESSFMQADESNYRAAYGTTESGENRWLLQYDHALSSSSTLVTAFSRMAPNGRDSIGYGLLGLRSFAKNVLYSSTVAYNDQGGYAFENGVQGALDKAAVGVSYTRLSHFVSGFLNKDLGLFARDLFKSNYAVNLFSVPTVRLSFEAAKTLYESGEENFTLTQRTSTSFNRFYLFNNLVYDQRAGGMTGELALLAALSKTELRSNVTYIANGLGTVSLEAQQRFSPKFTASLGAQLTVGENLRRYYVNLNQQLDIFTLTANSSIDSFGNYAIGALLSYSLGREPRTSQWRAQAQPQALAGACSVRVFIDQNLDGRFTEGEPTLENVEITVNQQGAGATTDKDGIAMISGMAPYLPADISITLKSLEDPLYRPSPRGFSIVPRPGKITRVDLPVIIASELTGFVKVLREGVAKPKRALTVELVNAEGIIVGAAKTEADGYFLVEEIREGSYTLRLNPEELQQLKLKAPAPFSIQVGPEGLSDNVREFVLEASE